MVIPATNVQQLQPPVTYGYAGPRPTTHLVQSYLSRQSIGLGVTLLVCGALAIVFNGVAYALRESLASAGHGFWTGCLLIVTGGFGIAAAKQKTKCTIVTFMVLAIITSVTAISMLAIGIAGATNNACSRSCYGYGCDDRYYDHYYYNYYTPPCSDKIRTAVAMEALLAIIAVVSGIACIWGSAICCKAVCCCSYTSAFGLAPAVYTTQYNQPVVVFNSQQTGQTYPPYYARPQIMPATLPTAPPPYVSTDYAMQYWRPQQLVTDEQNFSASFNTTTGHSTDESVVNIHPPAYTAAITEIPPANKL
jgi:hypothetical protein